MKVNFAQFSKKLNSTAFPVGLSGGYDCILKEGSSILKPRIGIKWDGTGYAPANYNYAYIGAYMRYYFVQNWTYEERQWWADLVVDPLASFKGSIGASSKYVLRSAYSHDVDAIDSMWNAKSVTYLKGRTVGSSLGWASYGSGGGQFVMTVIGTQNDCYSNDVAVQYAMDGPGLQQVINQLWLDTEGIINQAIGGAASVQDALGEMLKIPSRLTTDLSEYIKGLMWFPFEFSTTPSSLHLGVHPVSNAAAAVTNPKMTFTGSVNTVGVPSGKERWEMMAPYGRYWFNMQPFGTIEIDPYTATASSTLNYTITVDSLSGLGVLKLFAPGTGMGETSRIVGVRCAQIGVAVPYGSVAPNYAGAINLAAGAAAAAGAPEVGALLGGIGSAAAMGFPSHTSGTAGGGAALDGEASFNFEVFDHVDIDNAESGRPLCQTVTLSSIPGYILCKEGDIDAPATEQELAQIKSYLEGGFFYE